MRLRQVQLQQMGGGERPPALRALVSVQGGVVGLEVEQEGEGGRALGGGAGELGVLRVKELLLVVLGQVRALADAANRVAVSKEGVRGGAKAGALDKDKLCFP